MAYATVGDVKELLGVSGAGDDALISGILDYVTAAIDVHTKRTWEASDTTRTFDAYGPHIVGPVLYVDRHLSAITTITNGNGVEVTSDQYVTRPRNDTPYFAIQLIGSSTVTWEPQADGDWENAISITGKWSYTATPPKFVQEAAAEWAAFIYKQKDSPGSDVTLIDQGVTVRQHTMPDRVRELFKAYEFDV